MHFYQTDNNSSKEPLIEKLNSTLKITGSSISKKFTNIYDRLHHRDVDHPIPSDPSRTLLGIPTDLPIDSGEKYNGVGYFELPKNTPDVKKGSAIMGMFKHALNNWQMESRDRINMVVGIALIEDSSEIIENMKKTNAMTDEEYADAMELFSKNNCWDE